MGPWVETCLAALNGDPRFYTTAIAMDDLDEVREALGYETLNLYGVSYGTRAALSYLRKYPSRVRAVILDGVAPAEMPVEQPTVFDFVINLSTARDLGLTIPRSVLLQATDVIE